MVNSPTFSQNKANSAVGCRQNCLGCAAWVGISPGRLAPEEDESALAAIAMACHRGRTPRVQIAFAPTWYRDIGSGMGAALNAAQAMSACTISDRGTLLTKSDFTVLVESDPQLLNRSHPPPPHPPPGKADAPHPPLGAALRIAACVDHKLSSMRDERFASGSQRRSRGDPTWPAALLERLLKARGRGVS